MKKIITLLLLFVSISIFITTFSDKFGRFWRTNFSDKPVQYSDAETAGFSGIDPLQSEELGNEQNRPILYGFWDYVNPEIFPHVNTVKIDIDHADEVPTGVQIIPYIGNFKPDQSWEKRIRYKLQRLKDMDPDRIPFVILLDEPILKGWKRPEMEALVDLAKQTDDRFTYTYSFTRTHTERRPESEFPQNLDIAIINYYPFYHKDITGRTYAFIETEEQFYEDFQTVIEAGRRKAPGVTWMITGQAFFKDEKWRRPPAEAPLWYLNFISKNDDIIGLTWFTWEWRGSRDEGSATDMPEFLENAEKAFEMIAKEPE